MSTDVLPETQTSSGHAGSHRKKASGSRLWKQGLLLFVVVVVVALAVALVPGAMSRRESGPTLTHTIERGALVVTVIWWSPSLNRGPWRAPTTRKSNARCGAGAS